MLLDTRGDGKCSKGTFFAGLSRRAETSGDGGMAEGMGFEPTIRLLTV
jgi:hypothetical protein